MKTILFILGLCVYFNLKAQTNELKVFYIKGQATFRISPTSKWSALSLNTPLLAGYEVNTPPNATVIVIDERGYSTTLVQGKNEISSILKKLSVQQVHPSILSEFIAFIWSQLHEEHKDLEKYSSKYMRNKGIVSKNDCGSPLMEMPLYDTSVKSDSILFSWKEAPLTSTYTLEIYNAPYEGRKLYATEVKGLKTGLNVNLPFLKKGVTYFWSVFPTGKPNCTRFSFKIEKSESLVAFEKKLTELEKSLSYGDAMNAFVRAALLEQNKFYSEAQQNYELAFNKEPSNPIFKEAYELFIARNVLR